MKRPTSVCASGLLCVVLGALILAVGSQAVCYAAVPTLTSDKPDYHPGETVTLTGTGWAPNELVTMVMTVDPTTHGRVTLTSKSDAKGNFTNSDYVVQQSDLDVTFHVTATELTSGLKAQTTFTDTASVTTAPSVNVSADTAATGGTGVYTALGNIVLTEGANRDISSGTIILNAPTGFQFSTSATVTMAVGRAGGTGTLLTLSSSTATVASGTITITVSGRDASGSTRSSITWAGIQVRPTAGTFPSPNPGTITESGTATISGITGSTSFGSLTEVAGAANKLAFTTTPASCTGGAACATQPVVTVEDQFGNTVTAATNSITLAIGTNPSGGTLSVTTNPLAASSGVATFAGVSINKTGTGYTLTAAATGLTGATSNAFTITVGSASQLTFTTEPNGGTAGAAWTIQPVVTVQDAGGNTVTSSSVSITLTITSGTGTSGATLSCTANPKSASSGVDAFAGCSINKSGTGYTLTAAASGLTSATSGTFNISAGAASQLVFTTQPGGGAPGTAWAQQPAVTLEDPNGNTVTGTAQNVTLAIQTNAGPGGVLSGTTTVAVSTSTGVATFSGLSINLVGTGYTLTATGSTVDTTAGTVVSSAFNIAVPSCTWMGTTSANWATGTNWTTGCTGTGGVPGSGDGVVFSSSYNNACTINASPSLSSITINTGYTQTITNQGTVTVSGNFTQSGAATFIVSAGGGDSLSVGGTMTISLGNFYVAQDASQNTGTSGSLTVGAFSQSGGTFTVMDTPVTYNDKTASMAVNGPFSLNGTGVFNVALDSSSSHSATGTVTVTGNVAISGGTLNLTNGSTGGVPNGTVNVAGNFSQTAGTVQQAGSTTSGTSAIIFNGTTQTYTGGGTVSGGVDYAINSGSKVVLQSTASLGSSGTLTINSGGVFDQNCGTNSLTIGGAFTIAGSYTNCGNAVAGSSPSGSLTTGAMTVSGMFGYIGVGTITLTGNVSNTGTIQLWGGAYQSGGQLPLCGSGSPVTLTASSLRTWSGSGTFTLVNIAPTYQTSSSLSATCYGCTGASSNGTGSIWPRSGTSSCTGAPPTLVTFHSFMATPQNPGVLLQWRSGREVANLGYHIYRDGVRITSSPVAGSALLAGPETVLTSGNAYTWFDADGTSGSRYEIEDLDLNGTKTMHGPFTVENAQVSTGGIHTSAAGAGRFSPLLKQVGRGAASTFRFFTTSAGGTAVGPTALPMGGQMAQQYALAAGNAVKFGVQADGWYHVDASQLTAAGMPAGVDPNSLQLFVQGRPQALMVLGNGSAIEFYGQALNTTFSGHPGVLADVGPGSGTARAD